MAKFKQGDRVRRTGRDFDRVMKGGEYFVSGHDGTDSLLLSNLRGVRVTGSYVARHFELVDNVLDTPEEPAREQYEYLAVGTQLRCVVRSRNFKVGSYVEVSRVDTDYTPYEVTALSSGSTRWLDKDLVSASCGARFEVVQAEPEPDPYLSREAVFRNLLGGVAVQYYHCGEWLDINNTEEVTMHFIRSVKCRLKPSTVLVNTREVVRPISKNLIGTRGKYFSFRLDINRVISTDVHAGGLMWASREDAQAALNVVRLALETKSS